MITSKEIIILILSSSILAFTVASSTTGGDGQRTDHSIKGAAQSPARDNHIEQFLDNLVNKNVFSVGASLDFQLRNTQQQECETHKTFVFSSLSEEVKKEIEDVFNPARHDFELMFGNIEDDDIDLIPKSEKLGNYTLSMDYTKMPSFMKLFKEKCIEEVNGDVYISSLECKSYAYKDIPACFKNCPNGLPDELIAEMEEYESIAAGNGCNYTAATKITSAASSIVHIGRVKLLVGGTMVGTFLTMLML